MITKTVKKGIGLSIVIALAATHSFAATLNCNISSWTNGGDTVLPQKDLNLRLVPAMLPDGTVVPGLTSAKVELGTIGDYQVSANASQITSAPNGAVSTLLNILAKSTSGATIQTVGVVQPRKNIDYGDDSARRNLSITNANYDHGTDGIAAVVNCEILDN